MHPGNAGLPAELGGPAADPKLRFAPGVGDHLHLPPVDAPLPQPHPQGLGEGLLGGKAQGKAGVAPTLAPALGDFLGSKDAVQEALAIAADGRGKARQLDQINPDAVDHKAVFG